MGPLGSPPRVMFGLVSAGTSASVGPPAVNVASDKAPRASVTPTTISARAQSRSRPSGVVFGRPVKSNVA